MMREIRLALLEADVNLQVVKDFTKRVRERAIGVEVLESLTPAQQIVKIVDEELTITLGAETVELNKLQKIPTVIMMAAPTATVAAAYAINYDREALFTSNCSLLSTVVAVIAMPIWIVVLELIKTLGLF